MKLRLDILKVYNACVLHDFFYLLRFHIAESIVQPNLWLMVNPNLACPIKYAKKAAKTPTPPKLPEKPQTPEPQPASTPAVHTPIQQELHTLPIVDPRLNESMCDASSYSDYMVYSHIMSIKTTPYRHCHTDRL